MNLEITSLDLLDSLLKWNAELSPSINLNPLCPMAGKQLAPRTWTSAIARVQTRLG